MALVSATVTAVAVRFTTGASLTAVIVRATSMSAGLLATLPLPLSPPIREPVSSKSRFSVTSPSVAPLTSWFTFDALV